MVSTAFDLEASLKSFLKDGVLVLSEEEVGNLVEKMEQMKFDYFSPDGLDYLQGVLNEECTRSMIHSSLGPCKLAHWLRYAAFPEHIECFRKGGQEAGLRSLIVEHWPKGSRVDYYRGSHLRNLPTHEGDRLLHETSQGALHEAGCKVTEKVFPNGALVIRDARLYAEIKTGYVITFVFASPKIFKHWPEIIIPNSANLVRKIVEMETREIGINFAIKGST